LIAVVKFIEGIPSSCNSAMPLSEAQAGSVNSRKANGQQKLDRCMSHRASWDWKEVCGKSIPQKEQGSKRHSASKV